MNQVEVLNLGFVFQFIKLPEYKLKGEKYNQELPEELQCASGVDSKSLEECRINEQHSSKGYSLNSCFDVCGRECYLTVCPKSPIGV